MIAIGPPAWRDRTDVVVVGSGAAGLSAAIAVIAAGRHVTVVSKGTLGDGCTAWAQGGLAAVVDPADTVGAHIRDTLDAGAGLSQTAAVGELAVAAPGAIKRLAALGARFDREPDGTLALGLEGGHHARRIVHAGGDASGAEVARVLAATLRRRAELGLADVREDACAVDALVSDDDGAIGGVALIDADGAIGELAADAVILATGGIGQAWPVTSNPTTATGDGLGLALRAGAVVRDVEFVQFHPTVLVPPAAHRRPGDRGALISEAVRGEGARLTDLDGRPIMTGRHPLGDLAPRDVVAAAIHRCMTVSGADHVLLDATGFGDRVWRSHFPTILALCLARGVDPRVEPIPVAPAAHYSCGGVLADLDGVTSVDGLYAVGEVASTGVQGANRLASNSLTEALVAGGRVGARVAARVGRAPAWRRRAPAEREPSPLLDGALRASIVTATARGCGVLRDEDGLREQLAALAGMAGRGEDSGRLGPGALRAAVETTNLHTVSTAIATAARERTESRGCHRRSDFREPRAQWRRHQLLVRDDGEIRPLATEPVAVAVA